MDTLALDQRLAAVRDRMSRAAQRSRPRRLLKSSCWRSPKSFPADADPRGLRPGPARVRRKLRPGVRRQGAASRRPGRRALPPDRPSAVEQGQEGRGVVPGDPDRGLRQARAAAERGRRVRSTSCWRSSSPRRKRRAAPTRPSCPALIEAVRGCPNLRCGADDHAALVGRSGGVAAATSGGCGNWRSSTGCASFRWACRTTWRPRSKRDPPASASGRRCSGRGRRL